MKRNRTAIRLTVISMLAAISVILVYLIRFPIFPAVSFLEYDPADIPIFIGTMLFGPFYGLLLTAGVSIVQGLTVSASSGIVGIVMHFFATGSFVLSFGLIYEKHKTLKGSIIGSVVGIIVMTAFMTLWNMILTPIFMGVSRTEVMKLMLPFIIPFNLIKAFVNAAISFVLYNILDRAVNFKKFFD